MRFNNHANLEGKHAVLSASKYHWINYDDEKMVDTYKRQRATMEGTILHDFASQCINLKQRLPKSAKTLNMFVNDAIGYRMESEKVLYYSDNCFGTADAISFKKNHLRIHDLKTGIGPTHFEQLMIYAALFCLEYNVKPNEIDILLCIYQNNEIRECVPTADEIEHIMDKIITFDMLIDKVRTESIH